MPSKRQSQVRHFPKAKLLLDEGLPKRNLFPRLNNFLNIRHIKNDLGFEGLKDKEVYQIANLQNRIIVTFNIKDFRPILKEGQLSIIGLSPGLTTNQVDQKLTSFLKNLKEKDFKGKFFEITGETKS